MTFSDLASIGSFVGGVAVVISFVFLAFQLHQNARNQRATVHNERAALVQGIVLPLADAEFAAIAARGLAADESLTAAERQAFLFWAVSSFWVYEEVFYQYRDGMLDETRWAQNVRRFRTYMQFPGYRAALRVQSAVFAPEFSDWFESELRKTPATADAPFAVASSWMDLAKEEMETAKQSIAAVR